MKTIFELVEEVKSRERSELIDAVYKHGEKTEEGFEVRFDDEDRPIIAGYIGSDPCDIVIAGVLVTKHNGVYLEGYDKNDSFLRYSDLDPGDMFAGHLTYVTEAVVNSK